MFQQPKKATIGLCLFLVLVGGVGLVGPARGINPNFRGKQMERFVVLGSGDVLDVHTSLRWQKEPGSPTVTGTDANCNAGKPCVWQEAMDYCAALKNGSRLPEIKELISLVDYGVAPPGPVLPAGHPFQKVQTADYWSATIVAGSPTGRWTVSFGGGFVSGNAMDRGSLAWCVR